MKMFKILVLSSIVVYSVLSSYAHAGVRCDVFSARKNPPIPPKISAKPEPEAKSKKKDLKNQTADTPHDEFLKRGYSIRPRPVEETASSQNISHYYRNYFTSRGEVVDEPTLPKTYSKIRQLLGNILSRVGLSHDALDVIVVIAPFPNAWVIPKTGELYITTALVHKQDLTDGELNAILCHEVGHYVRRGKDRAIPKRFKNPLFEFYYRMGESARSQEEEYSADEIELVLQDLSGFSVDEALHIEQWLGTDSKVKEEKIKRYSPLSTHPRSATRVGVLRDLIESKKFKWMNRNLQPKAFREGEITSELLSPPKKGSQTIPLIGKDSKVDAHRFDPLSLTSVDYLAEHFAFTEGREIAHTYWFLQSRGTLAKIALDAKLQTFLLNLQQRIKEGDVVAAIYYKAFLVKLYLDSYYSKRHAQCISWLTKEARIEPLEVLDGLVQFFDSPDFWEDNLTLPKQIGLLKFIEPFPLSPMRDELIGLLLGLDGIVKNRKRFIDREVERPSEEEEYDEYDEAMRRWEFEREEEEEKDGEESKEKERFILRPPFRSGNLNSYALPKLLSLLHGTRILSLESILNDETLVSTVFRKKIVEDNFQHLIEEDSAADYIAAVIKYGIPLDVTRLEEGLREFIGLFRISNPAAHQDAIAHVYTSLIEEAKSLKYASLHAQRIEKLARALLQIFLDIIPAEQWDSQIIQIVENLSPSSEKNTLLIALDKAGVRSAGKKELSFEEIPDPSTFDIEGRDRGDVLNSLGFHKAQALYPPGQRILDRFVTEDLTDTGPLEFDAITARIPRPSPFRDELIDRCEVATFDVKHARNMLDAYWSPTAAYAKAYEIADSWITGTKEGTEELLTSIIEITSEFPSLKRRMIREFVDTYGVHREDYERVLEEINTADVVDVLKGGVSERLEDVSGKSKLSLALATFAASLQRGDHSLMCIQDLSMRDRRSSLIESLLEQHGLSKDERERLEDAKSAIEYSEFVDDEEKEEYEQIIEHSRRDFVITRERMIDKKNDPRIAFRREQLILREHHPFLPDEAESIANFIAEGDKYYTSNVLFSNGKPTFSDLFLRKTLARVSLKNMHEWNTGRSFFRFMKALGFDEAVSFYEDLFLGKGGIAEDSMLFDRVEKLFLDGIGLLLQEKRVPLERIETIKMGMTHLFHYQNIQTRSKLWARILAGIAQEQTLGEITREAIKPLGIAGGKLMQAIHSLTVGVDPTLENATRLALDQTAHFSLLDSLQFLGFHRNESPFADHDYYKPLGQGTERVAVAGLGGNKPDRAYLLVHSGGTPLPIVKGIEEFIIRLTKEGYYFPLSKAQFTSLVGQAELERTQGFINHITYGNHYGWQLGDIRIPKILEYVSDWAIIELVNGVSFSNLSRQDQKEVAPRIIQGVYNQFDKKGDDGRFIINPETHFGNIIVTEDKELFLVDCGLIGYATEEDLTSLFAVINSFYSHGISGIAARLLEQAGMRTIADVKDRVRGELIRNLQMKYDQITTGTPPELLWYSLLYSIQRAGGPKTTEGLDLLFRAVQHLSPYIRIAGKVPEELRSSLELPRETPLLRELNDVLKTKETDKKLTILPKGMGVGQYVIKGDKLHELGTLLKPADPSQLVEMYNQKLLRLETTNGIRFIQPGDLRVQRRDGSWTTLEEFYR